MKKPRELSFYDGNFQKGDILKVAIAVSLPSINEICSLHVRATNTYYSVRVTEIRPLVNMFVVVVE